MWPQPRRGAGESPQCHNWVFPEDSGGKCMQTRPQNDLVGAVRGTDGEARLGGQDSAIHGRGTGEEVQGFAGAGS